MASGKRFKFQGSTVSLLTEYGANSPASSITGVTSANPPVVTSAAHGRANGDVIYINSGGGMTELDGRVFIIYGVTTNTFKLWDADATSYTTFSGTGTFDYASFSSFCELTNWNHQGGSAPEITASTICSTRQEFERGLSDLGTVELSFNYAPNTTIQTALDTFETSGDTMAVKLALPNSGGSAVYLGFVQKTGSQGAVNQLYTASATIRLTGAAYRIS